MRHIGGEFPQPGIFARHRRVKRAEGDLYDKFIAIALGAEQKLSNLLAHPSLVDCSLFQAVSVKIRFSPQNPRSIVVFHRSCFQKKVAIDFRCSCVSASPAAARTKMRHGHAISQTSLRLQPITTNDGFDWLSSVQLITTMRSAPASRWCGFAKNETIFFRICHKNRRALSASFALFRCRRARIGVLSLARLPCASSTVFISDKDISFENI